MKGSPSKILKNLAGKRNLEPFKNSTYAKTDGQIKHKIKINSYCNIIVYDKALTANLDCNLKRLEFAFKPSYLNMPLNNFDEIRSKCSNTINKYTGLEVRVENL